MADWTVVQGQSEDLSLLFVGGTGIPVEIGETPYILTVKEFTSDPAGVALTIVSWANNAGLNDVIFRPTYEADGSFLPVGTYDIQARYRGSPRGQDIYAPWGMTTFFSLVVEAVGPMPAPPRLSPHGKGVFVRRVR